MLINRRTFSAGAAAALVLAPQFVQATPTLPALSPPVRMFTGHHFQKCMSDLARGKPHLDHVECILFDDESQLYAESERWQTYMSRWMQANREERERDLQVREYLLKHGKFIRRPAHLRRPNEPGWGFTYRDDRKYLPGHADWTYALDGNLHQPFYHHWMWNGRMDTFCHDQPGQRIQPITLPV